MEEFVFITMGFSLGSAGAAWGIYSAMLKIDGQTIASMFPMVVASVVALLAFLSTVRCIYAIGKTDNPGPVFAASLISGIGNLISGVLIGVISSHIRAFNKWWYLPYLLALTLSVYAFMSSLFVLRGTGIL
jgi:hypothetical protein